MSEKIGTGAYEQIMKNGNNMDTIKRAMSLLEALDADRYPETMNILDFHLLICLDAHVPDFVLAMNLQNNDADKALDPEVAALIIDIYKACIESHDEEYEIAAINNLGSLYYGGRLGKTDYKEAMKYYKKAADAGYAIAATNLAYCYYYGKGTDVDYAKAYIYLSMGMLQDDDEAIYKLGDMYRYGYFVEANALMARRLYERAYKTKSLEEKSFPYDGCKAARMGDVYFEGIGGEKDLMEALKYYQEAERGIYEQIHNGDRYHNELLKTVIARQSKIRRQISKKLPVIEPGQE